jgi:hypothetical protein
MPIDTITPGVLFSRRNRRNMLILPHVDCAVGIHRPQFNELRNATVHVSGTGLNPDAFHDVFALVEIEVDVNRFGLIIVAATAGAVVSHRLCPPSPDCTAAAAQEKTPFREAGTA